MRTTPAKRGKTNALLLKGTLFVGISIANAVFNESRGGAMSQSDANTVQDWDFRRWGDRLKLSAMFFAIALAVEWVSVIVATAW